MGFVIWCELGFRLGSGKTGQGLEGIHSAEMRQENKERKKINVSNIGRVHLEQCKMGRFTMPLKSHISIVSYDVLRL